MNVKPSEVIVFYPDGKRINWKITERNVRLSLEMKFPHLIPDEIAILHDSTMKDLRKFTKIYRVYLLYNAIQEGRE